MVYEAGHTTVHASNFLYFRMAAGGPILFTRDCFEYSEEDDLLGSGSFGSVYRCRLQSPKKKVPSSPKRLQDRYLLLSLVYGITGLQVVWDIACLYIPFSWPVSMPDIYTPISIKYK
jgi:hypothetical protein